MTRTRHFGSVLTVLTVLAALASCACPRPAPRIGDPVALGVVDGIESVELGEHRVLNVLLPPSYESSSARYPVIYLLDGSAHEDYHHMTGLVQFLTMYELMLESIVVGIANVDRYRDFTHATDVAEDLERLPTGGGSAPFIAFLERELQPYVDERYRTDGSRTLIGQSMGGLLAAEILIDHPHLFDSYVIASASLWWGGESLISRAAAGLRAHGATGKRVFVTLGQEPPKMHEVADALVAAIREHAPSFELGYEPLLDENHATVLHRGTYRAFEFFYGATHPGL